MLNAPGKRIQKRLAGCVTCSEPGREVPGVLGGVMAGEVGGRCKR
jgi:hypothetical protein